MDTATKTHCQVVDQIVEWTAKDGTLNIEVGDLVLHDGRFELVTEIHWNPAKSMHVAVGFDHQGTLAFKDPYWLVAVRRYIETTEE
jgi:hypothetical protein